MDTHSKSTPAWVLRMESANDKEGYCCSGFAAKVVAKEWRRMDQEIATLKELIRKLQPCCEDFTHTSEDFHKAGEPCPIESRYLRFLNDERA